MNNLQGYEPLKTLVPKLVKTSPRIFLTDEEVTRCEQLSIKIARKKTGEMEHVDDPNKTELRFQTGIMGELAVEKFLGKKFVDWTAGNTKQYANADLLSLGYKCGVKTSQKWNHPLTPSRPTYDQIICLRSGNQILLCGIATAEVLKEFATRDLVKSPFVKSKKGFYGFEELVKFSTKEELVKLLEGN